MLTSLSSAVTGLDSFQEDMDVIGNDIANVNTTGYKAANVDFADAFSQTLRAPGAATSTQRIAAPIATSARFSKPSLPV